MPRAWIQLSLTGAMCGTLLLATGSADPAPPRPESRQEQPAEPTPVDAPGDSVPAAPNQPQAKENQPADGFRLVPKGEQAEDKGPWEVTDRVELVFRDPLAVKGDKTLTAKVLLKNTGDDEIAGKLVLVIDGTSLPGTKLEDSQGKFTDETPYLQMVPAKRSLEAGDQTPVKSLILSSPESLKDVQADAVKLRWRAFTLTKPKDLEDSTPKETAKVPGKGYTWGELWRVTAVQNRVTPDLVQKNGGGIVGAGTSENENGQLILRVFASRGGMSRKIPGEIEGIPVEVTVSGEITAGPTASRTIVDNTGKTILPEMSQPSAVPQASGGKFLAQVGPPTRRFVRPVPIGVSSMNQTDVCASGTLSCRCKGRDGTLYVLSNCHVYGEMNAGTVGDPLCQPSQGDIACAVLAADVIGNLRDFQRLSYFTGTANFATAPVNIMDAAIGVTPVGQVDVATPAEGYGTPARTPYESFYPGLAVQKYGRTTAYTKGKIMTVNAEAVVNYGSPGLARFKGCIVVQTAVRTPAFGAPGDSGSLVVTLSDRRPVGILFAGGGFNTFLNPISPVLHRFNVGIDDGTGAAPVLGSGRMGSVTGPVNQHVNNVTPF